MTREEKNAYDRAWFKNNPEKRLKYQRSYAARHPERIKAQKRKSSLEFKFGITPEQYDAMFLAQGGVCAICKKPPTRRPLDVDHDHVSGKVRGLLCENHNKGIGLFWDSEELLLAAVDYLRTRRN